MATLRQLKELRLRAAKEATHPAVRKAIDAAVLEWAPKARAIHREVRLAPLGPAMEAAAKGERFTVPKPGPTAPEDIDFPALDLERLVREATPKPDRAASIELPAKGA